MEWKALPRRSKKKDGNNEKMNTNTEPLTMEEKLRYIDDAIKERQDISRTQTTLQSLDGTSGEFYECMEV